ncbi:Double-strand break repair protein AddB [Methylocella tundrae]|uniref:Double-strand break repair protein AddB n=1 Tax=Methylocella tundrae TaxID=227605 RepID=A0A4U8Z172_METTU|nr:double-strand break repair protein AddB [Methylocella tundrae]VFU09046.1 Double-strand break repair protein AddB [Methylocella tundrae]
MKKNVFTIAPSAPFLKTFAKAFLDGEVVEGFSRKLGPLALAEATIYVPTRRAARALTDEFSRAVGASATLLPNILPLGALEETETSLIFEEGAGDELGQPLDLPLAMGDIARRMQLSELILSWARALRHAIVRVDAQGGYVVDARESFLVATTAADAWHLSGELAGLIDELIIEDINWERLDPLVLPEFDPYWRITLDFLNIAIKGWPKILDERGLVDKARRQVALIEKQSIKLREGRWQGPVVAIGSTGSNRATARLLKAIAESPKGAVVLPGLDLDLDDAAFALIGGEGEHEAAFTHPQAAMSRLLRTLQLSRAEVAPLGETSVGQRLREQFLSQALRPAEATDEWIAYRGRIDRVMLDEALAGVSLIEAADEREEALGLAIAMREVLEAPGQTAALVTPDRELARRVTAELLRWGVAVDDSGGDPLSASPAGVLARLAIACAAEDMSAASLAALLAHPGVRLGFLRDDIGRLSSLFEIGVLRSSAAGERDARVVADPARAIAMARAEARDRFAHPAKRRISAPEWEILEDLLRRLAAAFAPALALEGEHDLKSWISAHRAAIAAITAGEDARTSGEDVGALDALFDELSANATAGMRFDAESYGFFFAAVARDVRLRGPQKAHPRLKILGLLEARLMDADLMLLGGLDETVWPPQARADAFLNRPMRAALGLTPPERKLGQTAHDFTQGFARARVILSRAQKRGGAPTVASRFLQRLAALGDESWRGCVLRGQVYVDLARAIDRPLAPAPPIRRPAPRPPLELRPSSLSVTKIETLRRDPYALYAERILELAELAPIGRAAGPAETGSAIHAALELFVKAHASGKLPTGARDELRQLLRDGLKDQLDDPDFRGFARPRLEKMIDFYLRFEAGRRDSVQQIRSEIPGKLELTLGDGSPFILTARADRIELAEDGSITLIDYKTGTPPGTKEILVGFAPQLTLEAAMARRGAFDLPPDRDAIFGLYLKLGGADGGEIKPVDFAREKTTFMDVADDHFAALIALLTQFRDPATPYPARPFPKFAKSYNAYDHLARVKEWSLSGETESGA